MNNLGFLTPIARSRSGSFLSRRRSLFEDELLDDVENILSDTVEILTNAEKRKLSESSRTEDDIDQLSDGSKGLVVRRILKFEESEESS